MPDTGALAIEWGLRGSYLPKTRFEFKLIQPDRMVGRPTGTGAISNLLETLLARQSSRQIQEVPVASGNPDIEEAIWQSERIGLAREAVGMLLVEAKARLDGFEAHGEVDERQVELARSVIRSLETSLVGTALEREGIEFGPITLDRDDDECLLLEWFFPAGRIGLYIGRDEDHTRAFYLDNTRRDEFGLPATSFERFSDVGFDAAIENVIDFACTLASREG